jgi:drug/metabolite transporter (DMT)-like permease
MRAGRRENKKLPARKSIPVLMLVAAALLFATGGAAIKLASLTAWQIAAFRSAVAAAALVLFLPEARRGWRLSTWLPAAAYAGTLILFVHANKLTTSANAVFLQACAPAYLLLIAPMFLKEKLRRTDLWMALLVITGMALFFRGTAAPQATAPNPHLGNLFGLLSSVTWALTLVGLRSAAKASGGNALPMVVAGNLIVFFVSLPQALPMVHVDGLSVAVVLYLGCFQVAFAYWLLTRGVRHVPALQSSLILLLEPVSNPVWSWLIHGERMDAWSLAGAGFVVAGVAFQAWGTQHQSN